MSRGIPDVKDREEEKDNTEVEGDEEEVEGDDVEEEEAEDVEGDDVEDNIEEKEEKDVKKDNLKFCDVFSSLLGIKPELNENSINISKGLGEIFDVIAKDESFPLGKTVADFFSKIGVVINEIPKDSLEEMTGLMKDVHNEFKNGLTTALTTALKEADTKNPKENPKENTEEEVYSIDSSTSDCSGCCDCDSNCDCCSNTDDSEYNKIKGLEDIKCKVVYLGGERFGYTIKFETDSILAGNKAFQTLLGY